MCVTLTGLRTRNLMLPRTRSPGEYCLCGSSTSMLKSAMFRGRDVKVDVSLERKRRRESEADCGEERSGAGGMSRRTLSAFRLLRATHGQACCSARLLPRGCQSGGREGASGDAAGPGDESPRRCAGGEGGVLEEIAPASHRVSGVASEGGEMRGRPVDGRPGPMPCLLCRGRVGGPVAVHDARMESSPSARGRV